MPAMSPAKSFTPRAYTRERKSKARSFLFGSDGPNASALVRETLRQVMGVEELDSVGRPGGLYFDRSKPANSL
jgi:hypothetical protein